MQWVVKVRAMYHLIEFHLFLLGEGDSRRRQRGDFPLGALLELAVERQAGGGRGHGQLEHGFGNVDGVGRDDHGLTPTQLHLIPHDLFGWWERENNTSS